jgi:hypothetical protein
LGCYGADFGPIGPNLAITVIAGQAGLHTSRIDTFQSVSTILPQAMLIRDDSLMVRFGPQVHTGRLLQRK